MKKQPESQRAVFEVFQPDGTAVRIWPDGHVEGLEGIVINRIPTHVNAKVAAALAARERHAA